MASTSPIVHTRQARLTMNKAVGLALLVFGGCTDATSSEVQPLKLPLRDRIVFASNRADSLYDIYVMKVDGTDPRRLTGDGKADFCPVISPDGNWIAYYEKDQCPPLSGTLSFSCELTARTEK